MLVSNTAFPVNSALTKASQLELPDEHGFKKEFRELVRKAKSFESTSLRVKINERCRVYRMPAIHNVIVIFIGNLALPHFHGSALLMRM